MRLEFDHVICCTTPAAVSTKRACGFEIYGVGRGQVSLPPLHTAFKPSLSFVILYDLHPKSVKFVWNMEFSDTYLTLLARRNHTPLCHRSLSSLQALLG